MFMTKNLSAVVALFLWFSCAQSETTPATMPANTWMAVPNSKISTVFPAEGQFPGTRGVGGPSNVIAAWCGAALDTKRNRLVIWGGGHADYHGNEVYVFDITNMKWERLTDPFVNPVPDKEVNADGTPHSRHTYGGLAYIAHADRFFGQGGSLAGVGFAKCDKSWVFDFETKKWTDRNPATTPGGGFGLCCAYDPVSKMLFWGAGDNGLWVYDYDQNTWTKLNSDGGFYEQTATIDSKRRQVVFAGPAGVYSYELDKKDFTRNKWTTSGSDGLKSSKFGFDYDPVSDRFVGWKNGAVYVLNPETKEWTANDVTGAPKGTEAGMYGRLRYVPSVNAFIVVTSAGEDVHFYKLSAGTGKPQGGKGDK
jgi:hypothetical protein